MSQEPKEGQLERTRSGFFRMTAIAASAAVVAVMLVGGYAGATHEPANKTSIVGSTVEVLGPQEDIVVLREEMRTASPEDLILQLSAECALTTALRTVGNDTEMAAGKVEMYITVDGVPVPVAGPDDGSVVFCDRAYQRTTSNFDDEDATIEDYIKSRTANAFNWVAFNVGSGIHTIEVHARLTQEATEDATAEAIVGARTLVIEPVKTSNHETYGTDGPTAGGQPTAPGKKG